MNFYYAWKCMQHGAKIRSINSGYSDNYIYYLESPSGRERLLGLYRYQIGRNPDQSELAPIDSEWTLAGFMDMKWEIVE